MAHMRTSDAALVATIEEVTVRRPSQPDLWFDPGYSFRIHAEERLFLDTLGRQGLKSLAGRRILDIGCGSGYWLRRFAEWGANPRDLHGIDILQSRIEEGRRRCLPDLDLRCGNATGLNFEDATFDIVSMSLMMSLLPDESMRHRAAAEAARVLKPGGFVLWYDFRYPPPRGGTQMIAMTRGRIRDAFPDFELNLRSASAVPPITRRLAPWMSSFCSWLDNLPFLNAHYVGTLVKTARGSSRSGPSAF
jgi:ubiquinone/menaquinone biosynthesis C-methylase UbiE